MFILYLSDANHRQIHCGSDFLQEEAFDWARETRKPCAGSPLGSITQYRGKTELEKPPGLLPYRGLPTLRLPGTPYNIYRGWYKDLFRKT